MDTNATAEPSADSDPGPRREVKALVYGAYALIAPLLVLNFVAARTVSHLQWNPSIMRSIREIVRLRHYRHFFADRERAKLFVRAAILTPSQVFGFIPGDKVVREDSRVERTSRGENWETLRRSVYQRDNYTCQCCGAQGGSNGDSVVLHADHIVPVSRGGKDDLANLRTLCAWCHQARHARLF